MHFKFYRALLAICFVLGCTISSQASQNKNIPQGVVLNVESGTLLSIFQQVQKQSDYSFAYNSSDIDQNGIVSIDEKSINLDKLLDQLSNQFDVSFRGINKVIYVKPIPRDNANIVPAEIEGYVKSADGEPLIGASIVIKEGANITGAITDTKGHFSLKLSPDAKTLMVSFIGYISQEIVLDNRTNYSITLQENVTDLNEVVVTAFGIKREEVALGYATQAVGGENLQTVKGVDVATSLTGKVSGLLVKNSSEFSEAPTVQLRGETPLLVIDGVPYGNMTLRDIPADNIESISVLKGAAASALYGYRGASGAIMVTTKRGSGKSGLTANFNSSSMFNAGFLAIPEMQTMYGREVNAATNTYIAGGGGAWGLPLDGREVIQWDPVSKSYKPMPYTARGKDNFKNFLEQGYILNNTIGVTQQGENGSIRSSASWVKNKGQYPNSNLDKVTYSLGGDIKMDKFTLSSSMSYNNQYSPNIGFNGYTAYDPMYNLLVWSAPDYDVRQYKDYWLVENESQNNSYQSTNNNPYFDRYERTHSINRSIFNGTVSMQYDFTDWLNLSMRTGLDNYNDKQEVQISKGSLQGAGSATVLNGGNQVWGESLKGSYNMGLGRGYSLNNDLLLAANKNFGNFNVDGFVGGTIYYNQAEGIESFTSGGLSIPGYYSLKSSVNTVTTNAIISKQQVNSLFGRAAVSYNNLVFVEGTLRNDWSSTLPESTRSYAYPSVAASVVLSELIPKTNWLTLWQVRSSYSTSKTPAAIYSTNAVYSITNNAWGNMSSAAYPSTQRAENVKPEASSTYEIGTQASFLKKRASLDVTYYSKRMYDFLRQASVSPSSGFYNNYVNTDEIITRKGIEITANVTAISTKDWRWDVGVNWSKYARYYTQLDESYSTDAPWVKVGERVDHYVLQDFLKDGKGNIIYNNGLPSFSPYSSLYGYSDPDAIFGITSNLKYKNFSLNISADGRIGGLAQTTTEIYMWRSGNHPKSLTEERYLDVTNPGTSNYVGDGVKVIAGEATYDTYGNILTDSREYAPNDAAVTYNSYVNSIHRGTAWGGYASPLDVYDATFFKIREISLGYMLPNSVSSKIGFSNCSVAFVGQNVFLWAKQFKYSDPDGGSENFSDPSIRYLGFNVNASF